MTKNLPDDKDTAGLIMQIRERLAFLQPSHFDLTDHSDEHVGHAGNTQGGKHLHLNICSPHFVGKSPIERHRMVYDALANLMEREIHALNINANTSIA